MKNRLMSYFVVLCICLSLYPTSVVSAAYDESSYKLTGNQINDIVGIASTQVEYHEGNSINDLSGTNQSGTNNYTKYAKDIGMGQGVAWCATFISWCARKANIPTSVIQSSTYAEMCIRDSLIPVITFMGSVSLNAINLSRYKSLFFKCCFE